MRRREVVAVLVAASIARTSLAQSPVARVAVLDPTAGWQAFVDALRERGWAEGRNLAFDVRSTEGRAERYRELAGELVALQPDLIIASSSQAIQAVREKTDTIPIVMVGPADPVGSGFVASLAQPGGNATGLSLQIVDIAGKALQLLTQARPGISRIGLFWVPDNPGSRLEKEALVAIAPRLGVTLEPVAINAPEDVDAALAMVARSRPDALFISGAPLMGGHRQQILQHIIALALDHRLPASATSTEWARDGLLMSYAPDRVDMWRRAADYVDRILKGAKPADLPVQQPTKFEFVINLKTARAIGLELPPLFVARADEVIDE
jgi:putative ABC transport system substrate-binding protein